MHEGAELSGPYYSGDNRILQVLVINNYIHP